LVMVTAIEVMTAVRAVVHAAAGVVAVMITATTIIIDSSRLFSSAPVLVKIS
jgi:hypothetical protein